MLNMLNILLILKFKNAPVLNNVVQFINIIVLCNILRVYNDVRLTNIRVQFII